MTEKKVNNSKFWYTILPICILLLLIFFVYVLFHVSSIHVLGTEKVHDIIRKLKPYSRA